jgi:hypothetical protein
VPEDPAGLVASYRYVNRGVGHWEGVLRRQAGRRPVWTCPHKHLAPSRAVACAEAELERRREGQGVVITLLRCEPCDRWLPAVDVVPPGCPVCGVPLERVKLVVAERGPA